MRFPLEALGQLGEFAKTLGDVYNFYPYLAGLPILASAALGASHVKRVSRPWDGNASFLNFYEMVIAESGTGKSDIRNAVKLPYVNNENNTLASYIEAKKIYDVYVKNEKKNKTDVENIEVFKPIRAEYFTQGTIQGIMNSLCSENPVMVWDSDEAATILDGYSMRESGAVLAGILSDMWTTGGYTNKTVSNGHMSATARGFIISWMTQPVHAENFLKNGSFVQNGLLPRFLLERYDDPIYKPTNKPIIINSIDSVIEFNRKSTELITTHSNIHLIGDNTVRENVFSPENSDQGLSKLPCISIEPKSDALKLFTDVCDKMGEEIENKQYTEIEKYFWSKCREHFLRFAAILSIYHEPTQPYIQLKYIENASLLIDYYTDRWITIMLRVNTDEVSKIVTFLKTNPNKQYTWRDITKGKGFNSLRSCTQATKILITSGLDDVGVIKSSFINNTTKYYYEDK